MKTHFDVIVIGGGPGGTPAAMQLASKGKKVLLVEKSGKLGGACLFSGCIPSKIVRHWANEYFFTNQNLQKENKSNNEEIWGKIKRNMEKILNLRSNSAIQMANKIPTLEFVVGEAKFLSNNKISIKDSGANISTYTFEKAIISTGAHSFIPPFKGTAVNELLTSEIFFNQEKLPNSLLIIGGGAIGVELSGMLVKLGVKCTVVEMADSILKDVADTEFVKIVSSNLQKNGVAIYTSSKVLEINKADKILNVVFENVNNEKRELQFEKVLVVAGKIPTINNLNLEATDIKFNKHGIEVNKFLQTSVPHIYATGDVINGPKFAHTATYEAHLAVKNMLFSEMEQIDFSKNSWVLFSDPEIASVGLTESQAKQRGFNIVTGVYDYKIDAAAQVKNDNFGYLKFVVNRKNSEIIGIHICNRDAASLIGEASLIISNHLTLANVSEAIHPHPTLTEAFGTLAFNMMTR